LLLTADFSGKLLLQIVNDILDFSKIQEGKLELNSTPEDLYSFVDKLAKVSEEKLNKKEIAFVAHIQPGTPRYLYFDTYRVRQILLNLLDNAVKFTAPEGGIMLLIEHEEFDYNTAKINFHIIDSGIGIDHNKIGEIFKPFTQEDSSTTRKFGGTGLGLSICSQLAELMQGSIKVRSKKMIGSVFTFDAILNICDIERVKKFSIESKASIPLKKCPFNILLAEDNLINQKVVKNILEKLEAKLLIANNGQEVIELLDHNQIDLILMDIQMPILDGLEATALIRNSDKETKNQIPIIALTAHALIEEKEKYLAAGMNDYVTKPVDKYKLVDAIHKVLELDKELLPSYVSR
jgi:CheY-like chemotaxis protein